MSDIDTAAADSLKVLDPERPIREADMTPDMLPDLYRGEPLVLAAKLGKLAGTMDIKGRIGDRPWSVTLPLANAAEGRGLSKLWARRKIADAEVAQSMRTLTMDEANKAILALALEHQLVTRLTSLVAVDQTPSRPAGEPLRVSELPLNLPAGWDFEKVFGEGPKSVPAAPAIERRADERDGRVRVAVRASLSVGWAGNQCNSGRCAARDRHRCRMEYGGGRRRGADRVCVDPS